MLRPTHPLAVVAQTCVTMHHAHVDLETLGCCYRPLPCSLPACRTVRSVALYLNEQQRPDGNAATGQLQELPLPPKWSQQAATAATVHPVPARVQAALQRSRTCQQVALLATNSSKERQTAHACIAATRSAGRHTASGDGPAADESPQTRPPSPSDKYRGAVLRLTLRGMQSPIDRGIRSKNLYSFLYIKIYI